MKSDNGSVTILEYENGQFSVEVVAIVATYNLSVRRWGEILIEVSSD